MKFVYILYLGVLDEISEVFYPLSIYDKITLLLPLNIPISNTQLLTLKGTYDHLSEKFFLSNYK